MHPADLTGEADSTVTVRGFNATLQQRTHHPDRKPTRKTALELHVRPNGPTGILRAFHPTAAAHASEVHTEHPPGRVTC